MGAVQRKLMLFSSGSTRSQDHDKPKTYSWDTKPKVDAANYTVVNAKDASIMKPPGSIGGEQFIIRNCQNTSLYILDHLNSVNIDDCTDCVVILGPTQGSVFLRNCSKVRIASACQQLRARDCTAVDFWLCCTTQPSIEACSDMRFGCLTLMYEEFPDQLKNARLSPFNNHWSEVYDFTPSRPEPNWTLLPPGATLPQAVLESCSVPMTFDPLRSHVPLTLGPSCKRESERCLVVLFWEDDLQDNTMAFTSGMDAQATLVQTQEACLEGGLARFVFNGHHHKAVKRGSAVALEYMGRGCRQVCQQRVETLSPRVHYISPEDPETTSKQIEAAFTTNQCNFS